MMWPRMTIAGLMTAVAAVGLALASLRSASSTWAAVEFTLTLGLLVASWLPIWYRRGPQRAYWAGFALFGWSYFLFAFGPWFRTEVEPNLATTRGLVEFFTAIHPPPLTAAPPARGASPPGVMDMDLYSKMYRKYDPDIFWHRRLGNFVRSGHCVFAQFFALVGALLAFRFFVSGRSPGDRTTDERGI